MTEHLHVYPERPQEGAVEVCRVRDCPEWRVWNGMFWRKLSGTELIDLTAILMEDIAIGQAMTIIHGEERGIKRAREVLGYKR